MEERIGNLMEVTGLGAIYRIRIIRGNDSTVYLILFLGGDFHQPIDDRKEKYE